MIYLIITPSHILYIDRGAYPRALENEKYKLLQ